MKTVAGNGGTLYNGDDQPAKNATMLTPAGLLYDAGTMYITEANGQRVRRVNLTTGIISRVAGNGTPGSAGDNGPALDATVNIPLGMNADADSIYWAEGGGNRIRRLERATGKIFTYVGSGGTYVPSPPLANPRVVSFDPSGNLYTAEFQGQSIRKVPLDANQPAVVVAGTFGAPGFDGDGGPADKAHLFAPVGVFEDAGFLYISDFSNHRVRRVAVDKTISTYVGGGEAGDGGPATATRLVWPGATLIDNDNLYISEYLGGQRVRRLNVATPVKLSPGTLNLESNGSSVTACIQLPEGRDAWNVNVASVRLQAVSPADGMLRPSPGHQVLQIAAAATPVARIDSDGDGMADQLVVKFDRSEIASWATGAGELSLRIEGQFAPTKANSPIGTYFSGDTKIRTK